MAPLGPGSSRYQSSTPNTWRCAATSASSIDRRITSSRERTTPEAPRHCSSSERARSTSPALSASWMSVK
jgi:hypothetical protein